MSLVQTAKLYGRDPFACLRPGNDSGICDAAGLGVSGQRDLMELDVPRDLQQ
jgi:hypothetical protein